MTPEASQSQTPLTDALLEKWRSVDRTTYQECSEWRELARSLELSLQKCEQAREAAEQRADDVCEEMTKIAAIVGRNGDWFNLSGDVEKLKQRLESAESQLRALRGEKT